MAPPARGATNSNFYTTSGDATAVKDEPGEIQVHKARKRVLGTVGLDAHVNAVRPLALIERGETFVVHLEGVAHVLALGSHPNGLALTPVGRQRLSTNEVLAHFLRDVECAPCARRNSCA